MLPKKKLLLTTHTYDIIHLNDTTDLPHFTFVAFSLHFCYTFVIFSKKIWNIHILHLILYQQNQERIVMRERIYKEFLSYLANATKEQLTEDYYEISTNHEGPLASDYIETALVFSQDEMYISEKNLMQTIQTDLTEDFNFSGYCLAA